MKRFLLSLISLLILCALAACSSGVSPASTSPAQGGGASSSATASQDASETPGGSTVGGSTTTAAASTPAPSSSAVSEPTQTTEPISSAATPTPGATTPTDDPSPRVGVSGVSFPQKEAVLTVGERLEISAEIQPANATNRAIDYTVSDPAVCAYEGGVLRALSAGEATLRAVTDEDGYIARLYITVLPSAQPTPTETPTAPTPTETPAPTETPVTPTPTETPVHTETPLPPTPTETPTQSVPSASPVICIDPGHGFANSRLVIDVGAGEGTVYNTLSKEQTGTALYEADLNLQIALRVQALLEDAGYTVKMLRTDYVVEHLPISARAELVKNSDAELLVSIHANAAANLEAHGARIYYNGNAGFARFAESQRLAQSVLAAIESGCPDSTPAYIVDGQNLAMLNGSGSIPGVLVETCFLTNEGDARLALDDAWQDAMARAIVSGILAALPSL